MTGRRGPCLARDRALAEAGGRLVYLSDSGFTPYGKVPRAELAARLRLVRLAAARLGADALAVACNAMSVAVPDVEAEAGIPVLDIVRPGIDAFLAARQAAGGTGPVGIVGGARTIRSGVWAGPLRAAGMDVTQRIAQPLSAIIERGGQRSGEFLELAGRVCAPFRTPTGAARIDALVLACTHYPAALDAFRSLLPGIDLFDPAPALARTALAAVGVARAGENLPSGVGARPVPVEALTTGDPDGSRRAAALAFGLELAFARAAADWS